jgi:hypothetical protein
MKPFKKYFLEQTEDSVAILSGGFKPPHAGHFDVLKDSLEKASKGIVFIGKNPRGVVTANMSAYIWEIYSRYLSKPIEIKVVDNPLSSTFKYVDGHMNTNIILGVGKKPGKVGKPDDENRYNYFVKNKDKYPLVEIFVKKPTGKDNKLMSGSIAEELIRQDINNALDYFLPDAVKSNRKDVLRIKNILLNK